MAFGFMATQTLRATVELGLLDAFGTEGRTPTEIAGDLGIPPDTTIRLLRALAALNILAEPEPGVFRPTATGNLLRTDHPNSLGSFVTMFADPLMGRAWEKLADSIRTGKSTFAEVYGQPFFSYLATDADKSALFNRTMATISRLAAGDLLAGFDFAPFHTILDIGGGNGTTIGTILAKHQHLRGVVYDSAAGSAGAHAQLDELGVGDRCTVTAGDFFAEVPSGADLYLLKSVLHDWDDDEASLILRNCRSALPPAGRLLIAEPVLPETDGRYDRPETYFDDLNMLVNVGGRTRTIAEFERLCAGAGLEVTVAKPLSHEPEFLIEAKPV
ncbi:methyltransferase [Actinophytocola sediminis]